MQLLVAADVGVRAAPGAGPDGRERKGVRVAGPRAVHAQRHRPPVRGVVVLKRQGFRIPPFIPFHQPFIKSSARLQHHHDNQVLYRLETRY